MKPQQLRGLPRDEKRRMNADSVPIRNASVKMVGNPATSCTDSETVATGHDGAAVCSLCVGCDVEVFPGWSELSYKYCNPTAVFQMTAY
jgi:hypothetical protein